MRMITQLPTLQMMSSSGGQLYLYLSINWQCRIKHDLLEFLAQAGSRCRFNFNYPGSILYRDGSGLQRLAPGTANQDGKLAELVLTKLEYLVTHKNCEYIFCNYSFVRNIFTSTYDTYIFINNFV